MTDGFYVDPEGMPNWYNLVVDLGRGSPTGGVDSSEVVEIDCMYGSSWVMLDMKLVACLPVRLISSQMASGKIGKLCGLDYLLNSRLLPCI